MKEESKLLNYLIQNNFVVENETFDFNDLKVNNFNGMMPRSITDTIIHPGMSNGIMFADKIDGERVMIYLLSNKIIIIDRMDNMYRIECDTGYGGTCLDAEFKDGVFVVVDMPYFCTQKLSTFQFRYAYMRTHVPKISCLPLGVQVFRGVHLITKSPIEGLIFIESKGMYNFFGKSSVFKWKLKPTFDFLISDKLMYDANGVVYGKIDHEDGIYEFDIEGHILTKRNRRFPNSTSVITNCYNETFIDFEMLKTMFVKEVFYKSFDSNAVVDVFSKLFPYPVVVRETVVSSQCFTRVKRPFVIDDGCVKDVDECSTYVKFKGRFDHAFAPLKKTNVIEGVDIYKVDEDNICSATLIDVSSDSELGVEFGITDTGQLKNPLSDKVRLVYRPKVNNEKKFAHVNRVVDCESSFCLSEDFSYFEKERSLIENDRNLIDSGVVRYGDEEINVSSVQFEKG